tara:strand:+ start:2734 stop:3507 length:774 start_codon:yes stop_codon:yes gene_type:complete
MNSFFFLAIVQARCNSSRLPKKVLKKVQGKTLLEFQCSRILNSKKLNKVIIATTKSKVDDSIVTIGNKLSLDIFRGSEKNVLERYYKAAFPYNLSNNLVVIRLTGDCPLMDPELIDVMIEDFENNPVDYLSNTLTPTFPDGLDIEIITFNALKLAFEKAKYPSHKEHVTLYIKESSEFKKRNFYNEIDYSKFRLTVDEEEDFVLIKNIIKELEKLTKNFNYIDVINLLTKNPDLFNINKDLKRDSGLILSLKKEGRA